MTNRIQRFVCRMPDSTRAIIIPPAYGMGTGMLGALSVFIFFKTPDLMSQYWACPTETAERRSDGSRA